MISEYSNDGHDYFEDLRNKREKKEKGKPHDNLVFINNPIMPDIEEIAERDKKLLVLRDLLLKNKEELKVNESKIESEAKNNGYLKDVLKNYRDYKSYIITMKKKQKEAMDNISQHLEKISNENNLSEGNLERIKLEQNQILDELDKVKKELKELTLKP
jgi:chromosome segregation ATPase